MIPYHKTLDELQNGYLNCTSYIIMKQIHTMVPLLLLLVGTLGNALSLMVLSQQSMRKLSIYTYLGVLSVVDTLVLYSGVLPEWLDNLFGYTIHQWWLCTLKNVVKYTVSQFSVWIIVAVTVERYIATAHTLSAVTMCTRKRAIVVMLVMYILLFIMNGHLLFTSTIITFYNYTIVEGDLSNLSLGHMKQMPYAKSQCSITDDEYIDRIWPWVDACFYSLIPCLVILSLNILIIRAVQNSKSDRKYLGRITSAENQISNRESEVRMTRLLILISFVFMLTTLPVNIVWIVKKTLPYLTDPCQRSHVLLAMVVGRMLMYTNHSVNFFLYLLSGIKFRQKLFSMTFNGSMRLTRGGQRLYRRVNKSFNRRRTHTTSV